MHHVISNERGQVAILVLGLALVAMAVVGVVVDGTRAFLLRRTLQSTADAAAVDAAVTLDEAALYRGGPVVRPEIDPRLAASNARQVLARRGVDAEASVRVSGETVTIVLRDSLPTTFLGLIGVSELSVAVDAVAVPVEGD